MHAIRHTNATAAANYTATTLHIIIIIIINSCKQIKVASLSSLQYKCLSQQNQQYTFYDKFDIMNTRQCNDAYNFYSIS